MKYFRILAMSLVLISCFVYFLCSPSFADDQVRLEANERCRIVKIVNGQKKAEDDWLSPNLAKAIAEAVLTNHQHQNDNGRMYELKIWLECQDCYK